jgi:Leucine-rich repeat (LRR) protein
MGNFGLKQHYEMAKSTGTLDLSRRKLDKFPEELVVLAPCLRSLNLADNKFALLSADIQKLTLLKNLNISGNRLTELPEAIGDLVQLKRLNLSSNQISALPASLSRLKNLEQVSSSTQ